MMKKLHAALLTLGGTVAAMFMTKRNSQRAPVLPPEPELEPEPETDPVPPERSARERVHAIAVAQMGRQNPDTFWAEVCPPLQGTSAAWCGGFALWVLRHAGLTQGRWIMGKGFASKLPQTKSPQLGDIAYFHKLQHHAIVESVSNGTLITIDGNQPGETVQRRARDVRDAAAVFSIQPLVDGRDVLADNVA